MSLENLVDDSEFVAWVQYQTKSVEWNSWLETQNDEVREQIRIARTMILSLTDESSANDMNTQSIERLWNRINQSISISEKSLAAKENATAKGNATSENQPRSKIFKIIAPIISIAAIGALLIFFVNRNSNTIQFHESVNASLTLNLLAASSIKLHPGSDVQYDEKNWDQSRKVTLDGTAEFDVTKGVSFIVDTDLGSVEVLGTSFLVKEEEKTFVVNVSSGRVAIKSGVYDEVLTKGMAYLSNPSAEDRIAYSGENYTYLSYDGLAMSEVLQGIEDYYQITFEGQEENRNRVVSTVYETGDLDKALRQALFPVNWKYEIQGNRVILF